jgi:putative peptide zinc metalloprotease protein
LSLPAILAPAPALPSIREDLRLYPGAAYRDGSPSWRIQDPLRNVFFEIGWLEFELLARWRNRRDPTALIDEIAAETTLRPTLDEVTELVGFLAANQLLAPESTAARESLVRRREASKRPWYESLLHNYLFFRLPLVQPDGWLGRTVHLTDVFFTRGFWCLVVIVLGVDLYLLGRDWHAYTESFVRLLTPQGLFGSALALTFAKLIHELGHAYTAKRYGVRVPAMGIAFLVMWPFPFTDTGETWKLANRRKQLTVASAGVIAELTLAVFASLAWAISPEGSLKGVFFVLATTSWLMTLAVNASPFMRFDGYFVLSDALDFPNLHERSFACARWWFRTTLFGLPDPLPEPTLSSRQRRWLIAFASITRLYRLVVFFGIALLVYHMFFKLLGVVMMVVELWWFILAPIVRECRDVWQQRGGVRLAAGPLLGMLALVTFLIWLVPMSKQVSAPGILRAAQEQSVFAPFPARLETVDVSEQQPVAAGTLLIRLDAPDLKLRGEQAEVAIASARAELARTPASETQQESRAVLERLLAESLASREAVQAEKEQQILRTFHAGTVRDLPSDLVPGRWVHPNQLLMRVVSSRGSLIEAFVSERQVRAIAPGQAVRFYSSRPNVPTVIGRVLAVDKTPIKEITRPLLASVNGGDIPVKPSPRGALIAQDAVFRVTIQPDSAAPPTTEVIDGTVRIETDLHFVAENFLFRALSVLIRESGM